jgi:pimeloyl-ACP methyl ester carboxylesterase
MPNIVVNGLRTYYERGGLGEPLVLLHGILHDSRGWSSQLEALSNDFDVIVPDLPGCGQSDDPPESHRTPDYGRWLTAFVEALATGPAHVCGLSWGGMLAIELYRQRPDMVASLILADTYAGWKGSLPPATVSQRLQQCLAESEMAAADFIPGWMPGLLTDAASTSMRAEVATIMSDFHPAGYRTMARCVAESDLTSVLPMINVPTLLIWGAEDRRSPASIANAFHATIPHSTLALIPDSGHLSNIETTDAFNQAIRDFVAAQKSS